MIYSKISLTLKLYTDFQFWRGDGRTLGGELQLGLTQNVSIPGRALIYSSPGPYSTQPRLCNSSGVEKQTREAIYCPLTRSTPVAAIVR